MFYSVINYGRSGNIPLGSIEPIVCQLGPGVVGNSGAGPKRTGFVRSVERWSEAHGPGTRREVPFNSPRLPVRAAGVLVTWPERWLAVFEGKGDNEVSSLALNASTAISLGVAVGVSLTCSPRVSIGDNGGASLVIGFVPKSSDNPIFMQALRGAQQAGVDSRQKSERTVYVTPFYPTGLETQQAELDMAVTAGVNGILVSCASDDVSASIDKAAANGIPVITFDSDCPSSKKRLGFFGTANEDAGSEAADLLVQAMDGRAEMKRVAILTGQDGAVNLDERSKGVNDRIRQAYPNVTVLDPFHCEDEDPDLCSALLDKVVGDHEDLDGLFVVGLWGVGAACNDCKAPPCACDVRTRMPHWHAAAMERSLKTVAFDALPFELQLMNDGYLSALIGQKYYDWGYCTTKSLVNYLTRGEPVRLSRSGYDVVANEQDVKKATSMWNDVDTAGVSAQVPDCGDAGL